MNKKTNWGRASTGFLLILAVLNAALLWSAYSMREEAGVLIDEARGLIREVGRKAEALESQNAICEDAGALIKEARGLVEEASRQKEALKK
ncbi:MAG: hypothetical protein ISN29_12505 [Gammaproteobacteria bacterium AqS3]|nr:hypothetical protein [Gammaproteobacteria bacterium AqS3]